ncbi:alpha/beta fold hydrolase [Streptomyces sp. CB02923]|uniref:alpha/beta fold hydrolase n=1 Tax=Streptomyces sp. CB02923 TaxID=1718985 RepID=UPI0009402690
MKPFVRATATALPDDGVLLAEARYRLRGWNGPAADALYDTRQALRELAEDFGDVPVVLVAHSMGGRAALRAADLPQVCAVLALAPCAATAWPPSFQPRVSWSFAMASTRCRCVSRTVADWTAGARRAGRTNMVRRMHRMRSSAGQPVAVVLS